MKSKLVLVILLSVIVTSSSLSQALEQFSEGWKYGFRDKATKKTIIAAKYYSVEPFVDGIAAVSETEPGSPNMKVEKKWDIINLKGVKIIDEQFDRVELKKNGLAFVYKSSGYSYGKTYYKIGVLNKEGAYIVSCEMDAISEINDKYYRLFSKEKGVGIIDKNGKWIIEMQNKFNVEYEVGCGLFNYTNEDPNRKAAVSNSAIGGLINSKLDIIMNQDSLKFNPSSLINASNCGNINNLFGLTGGKSSQKGIYRVGFGIVVPIEYQFGGFHEYKVVPNAIEVYEKMGKKLIAKYDYQGKKIFPNE
jgi:hypothetical protein